MICDPSSGKNLSPIPDQGIKKLNPGSATMLGTIKKKNFTSKNNFQVFLNQGVKKALDPGSATMLGTVKQFFYPSEKEFKYL